MDAREIRSRTLPSPKGYSHENGDTYMYGDHFDATTPHKATDSAPEAIDYNLIVRKPQSALNSAHGLEEGVSRVSSATIQNARLVDGTDSFQSTHPNEDEHFVVSKHNFKAFGVLDGHGHSASSHNVAKFARDKFCTFLETKSWQHVVRSSKGITEALTEFFKSVEGEFFADIKGIITEVERLKAAIPSVSTPPSPSGWALCRLNIVFRRP